MIKIHKEVYGQGLSIVLIHGWAMHTGIWRQFAQQLAQNYQVTCLDLPGHGLSDDIEPYTLDHIVEALLVQMPEQPSCVLGWSLGATVAVKLAEKNSKWVNSVIILAGNPRFVSEENWAGINPKMLDEFAGNLQLNCQQTLIRFLALQVNKLPDGKKLLKILKQAIEECNPPSKKVLQSALNILKHIDLRETLIKLTCSVSVIQGDNDALIPVQVARYIKSMKPEVSINIIEGAGHVPFLSHQSKVIEIIKQSL